MSEGERAFFWASAAVLIALIAAVCAWSLFGQAATCARACGPGRMSKWSPSQTGVTEQCVCEPRGQQ